MKGPLLLWIIAGFVGWSLAFVAIYGLHGVGCSYGWDAIAVGPTNLQRLVQITAWLAFLPPLVMLALWFRRRRTASGNSANRWLVQLGETCAWAGLAATIVTFAPTLTSSVCV